MSRLDEDRVASVPGMRPLEDAGTGRWQARLLGAILTGGGALAVLLVVTRYRHTYFFYDEWGMIDRVTNGQGHLAMAFRDFNGHLWAFPYLVYLGQVRWFGLVGHWPVFAVFCVSLLGLYASLVSVLRALRVPLALAVAVSLVVTYFGQGAQSMVFEVQLSWNLAAAFGFLAATIVLRSEPGWRPVCGGAACLLVASGWDGVAAVLVGVFVATVALGTWRRPDALLAVAPAWMLVGIWWVFGGRGGPDQPPASAYAGFRFASRLVLAGFGGLLAHGQVVGAFAAGVVLVCLVLAWRSGRLGPGSRPALLGGAAAAALSVAVITWTRGGLVGDDLRDYNRYIQLVAIFLVVALVPALVEVGRSGQRRLDRRRAVLATVAVVVVFVAGFRPMRSYRSTFEAWNMQTHAEVAQAANLVAEGCPAGLTPDPSALPLGSLDPQISVSLLQRLQAQHVALPKAKTADPKMVAAVCTPEHASRPAG